MVQSVSAQRPSEPVQSRSVPTLVPPTPSEPNCYTTSQLVPQACIHVLHGGSESAAGGMNKNKSPQYEMSCEIQVPLATYFGDRAFVAEKGMLIDFSIYGLYGGGEGKNFENGYARTVGPDEFHSFNEQHPAKMSDRVSYTIFPGSQDMGTTSGEKVAWWRANLDVVNKTLSLRSTWNGWGKCRWKDPHCYAYINQLKLTFEVCESQGIL